MTSKVALLVLVCLAAVILADLAEGTKSNCSKCSRRHIKDNFKNKFDSWKKKLSNCTPRRSKHAKKVQASFDKCYQTIDNTLSKDSQDDTASDKVLELTDKFQNFIEQFSTYIGDWLNENKNDDTCRTDLKSTYDKGCAELQKYSEYEETREIVQTCTTSYKKLYEDCNSIIVQ